MKLLVGKTLEVQIIRTKGISVMHRQIQFHCPETSNKKVVLTEDDSFDNYIQQFKVFPAVTVQDGKDKQIIGRDTGPSVILIIYGAASTFLRNS